jgi:hypothetical protein
LGASTGRDDLPQITPRRVTIDPRRRLNDESRALSNPARFRLVEPHRSSGAYWFGSQASRLRASRQHTARRATGLGGRAPRAPGCAVMPCATS